MKSDHKVTRIIDHHHDYNAYPAEQLTEKVVRFIGSACSLLVLKIKEDLPLFQDDLRDSEPINFAYCLAAPIVLDSYNFDPTLKGSKFSHEDEEAITFLRRYAQIDDAYFTGLSEVKFD